MNREIIFKSVQDIFRDIFDEDTLIISDKTISPSDSNFPVKLMKLSNFLYFSTISTIRF